MIYPERTNPDTRIIAIDGTREDILMRLELIRQAKSSIKIINFTQPLDDIGYLFIAELREACGRGINVQFVFEELYLLCDDRKKIITSLVSDPRLKKPGQVISLTYGKKKKHGYSFTDLIHEKILIVDEEVLVIGGRGHDAFTLKTLDSAFAIYKQSNDSLIEWIGQDFITYFDAKWNFLFKIFGLNKPNDNYSGMEKYFKRIDQVRNVFLNQVTPEVHVKIERSVSFFFKKVKGEYDSYQPESMQLITHDLHAVLYDKWIKTKKSSPFFHLENMEKNDISNFVEGKISKGLLIELTSYSFSPPKHIMNALKTMVKNGGQFKLLTNDRAAHGKTFPTTIGFDLTHNNLEKMFDKLLSHERDRISIYFHSGERNTELVYLHKKQLIVDDTLFIGTDNFTKSSAAKNSEFVVAVKDHKMLESLKKKTGREIEEHFIFLESYVKPTQLRFLFLKFTGLEKLAETLW